jgi:signal transduction histidine kinase
VRSLYEDAEGTLWVGTYDGGLSRLKAGRLTTYRVAQGLFNSGVFQILEDGRGNFWISCNRGIYRVGRQQLNDFADGRSASVTCIAYGKLDGMLNTECNGGRQPAGVRARDGKLWFPTQGGVVVIDPAAVPFNAQPPPVLIESVSLDGTAIGFRAGVRVEPGQSSLLINYTGLSYVKPEQVRFKYRLFGQDNDWIDAGTRRVVNYSHLSPGSYTFQVVAANSDGVWNNAGASLRIAVLPPFYRTWWFLSLTLLAVTGLAALAHQIRVRQLKRLHAAQEAFSDQLISSQEQERQRIAAELHDSLGQNLLIIKNRALLSLKLLGDTAKTQEQIEEISTSTSEAIKEVRQIAYNLRPYHLDEIGLTQALEEMVERLSHACPIKFTATIDLIDDCFTKEAEINLYRIVQECLNNTIKHARATEAEIQIRRNLHEVELVIHDNGQGFTPEAARNGETGRRGFGLTGMAERARILGGKLALQSAPGQGTTITLTIALGNQYRARSRAWLPLRSAPQARSLPLAVLMREQGTNYEE